MACEHCIDQDGATCLPSYGPAPHKCFYKIGKPMGQSETLPADQWPEGFTEDPNTPGMGTYWCPMCGHGKPETGCSMAVASPTHHDMGDEQLIGDASDGCGESPDGMDDQ